MDWIDLKQQKPEPMTEVLVWVDGHRHSMWRNNHALVAYMTRAGEWFEERHQQKPLIGVLFWSHIGIPGNQ